MIYTVTFNPAIDYVIKVDDLTLGKVNRTKREDVYCGGKGINVSNVLSNLGIDSVGLGFIAGFTGDAIEAGAKKLGFQPDFIRLREGMTRINVKIKSNEESEINGQGPVIHDDELEQMFQKIDQLKDGDMLVLAGSIPASLPEDIYERIMERLQGRDIQIVVDATKDLLLNVLKYHPFMIKPNNHELGEMFGIELKDNDEIIEHAKKLQEKGARNVLVSMAGDGAILVTEDGDVHMGPCPKGEVKNSVGAGDSMVAGFITGYLKSNGNYEEAIRCLNKSVELNPDNDWNWAWLGNSYNKNCQFKEAKDIYNKLLENNKDNKEIAEKLSFIKYSGNISKKSWKVALILAVILPSFHRFYAGKIFTGIIDLIILIVSFSTPNYYVFGFFYLIDIFFLLIGKFKDKNGQYIIPY